MSQPSGPPTLADLRQIVRERGNVVNVCEEHASQPGGFVGQAAESFVGRYVKLCFPRLSGGNENMWVQVERLGEDGQLIGTLGNEPTSALVIGTLHLGDLLSFGIEEIAATLPGS
jgi:hypothetical protein